jgi:hypothetical protein
MMKNAQDTSCHNGVHCGIMRRIYFLRKSAQKINLKKIYITHRATMQLSEASWVLLRKQGRIIYQSCKQNS